MQRVGLAVTGPLAVLSLVATSCSGSPSALSPGAAPATRLAEPSPAPSFETIVDNYSPADRRLLRHHLDLALSRLTDRNDEFEVVAAINSYLYQYLEHRNDIGDGADILRDGHAICGGSAEAMSELLYLAGIRSRQAFLLGIPYQGNHSLVEVYFPNGSEGLFDPTFGVFWYSRGDHPVPMRQLLADPALSRRTLYKTIYEKRRRSGKVVPIRSVADGYRLRLDYSQASPRFGGLRMDWTRAFTLRRAGGVADGHEVQTKIPIRPGSHFGSIGWDRAKYERPWLPLALAKDAGGRSLAWAYQIGQWSAGYNVAHAYRLTGLEPGKRYTLRWIYPQALPSLSTGAKPLMRLRFPGTGLRRIPLVSGWFSATAFKPHAARITFVARRSTETVLLRVRGSALFQAISLDAAT